MINLQNYLGRETELKIGELRVDGGRSYILNGVPGPIFLRGKVTEVRRDSAGVQYQFELVDLGPRLDITVRGEHDRVIGLTKNLLGMDFTKVSRDNLAILKLYGPTSMHLLLDKVAELRYPVLV